MTDSSLPQPLFDALQAVELPAAWAHLRGLATSDPALMGDAVLAFARVAHMRVLAKRAKPNKLGAFMMNLGIWDDLASQVVLAPENGETLEPGHFIDRGLHLIADASAAPEAASRSFHAPVPPLELTVACGATIPIYRAMASYWEEPRAQGGVCLDCQRHALDYAEAWTGRCDRSVTPPWLPISLREALIGVIAGAAPAALDRAWPRAQGALADAAFAELWRQVAAWVVHDCRKDAGPNRSSEQQPERYSSDERIGATDRRLKLMRAAADAAGDTGPLLARLTAADWQRIFSETRGDSQQVKKISAAVAATLGDPMLVAAVV